MRRLKVLFLIPLCLILISEGYSEEYRLPYFLEKCSNRSLEVSKKERVELLNQVEKVLEQTKQIQVSLSRAIQLGEADIRFQEGQFWMNRLDEDQKAIETGAGQLKILREKPANLVAAIILYKSLKDLAFHFNSCSNIPAFAPYIGDVAPELELWADPVFFKIYLLPLAQQKGLESKPPGKEKKTEIKGKKP